MRGQVGDDGAAEPAAPAGDGNTGHEGSFEVIRVGRSPRAPDRRSPTSPGVGAVAYGAVSPGGAVGFMGETGPSSVRHHRSASSRA